MIEQKFEHENNIAGMAKKEILIYLENMVDYLKLFIENIQNFGITKDINYLISTMKMRIKSIIKYILINSSENKEKNIFFKSQLYPSYY